MKKFTTALLSGAAIMFAATSAHAIVIDDFDTPTPAFNEDADFVPGDFAMNAAGIADSGVERLVSATQTGGSLNLGVAINGNPSFLSVSADSGVSGDVSVLYQDIAGSYFTDISATDRFRIFAQSETAGGTLQLTVDGVAATAVPIIADAGFVAYDIAFSEFGGGFDLTDGATILLDIVGTTNIDLDIEALCTASGDFRGCNPPVTEVSEPATLGLLGLGLVGIGAAVRRRKA